MTNLQWTRIGRNASTARFKGAIPDGDSIRMRRPSQRAELVAKGGIQVEAASTISPIDAIALIKISARCAR